MKVADLRPGMLVARRGHWVLVGEVVEVETTSLGGYKVRVRWRNNRHEWEDHTAPSNCVLPTEKGLELYRLHAENIRWRKRADARLDKVFDEVRAMVPFKLDDYQLTGQWRNTIDQTRKSVKVELTIPQLQRLLRASQTTSSGDERQRAASGRTRP